MYGTSAIARPWASWYTAQPARSRASSANGSVMNATSARVNEPGDAQSRLVYIAATHWRRAAGVASIAASSSGRAPCSSR